MICHVLWLFGGDSIFSPRPGCRGQFVILNQSTPPSRLTVMVLKVQTNRISLQLLHKPQKHRPGYSSFQFNSIQFFYSDCAVSFCPDQGFFLLTGSFPSPQCSWRSQVEFAVAYHLVKAAVKSLSQLFYFYKSSWWYFTVLGVKSCTGSFLPPTTSYL